MDVFANLGKDPVIYPYLYSVLYDELQFRLSDPVTEFSSAKYSDLAQL